MTEIITKVRNRSAAFVNAVIVALVAFGVIDWSVETTALVVAAVLSTIVLGAYLWLHLLTSTPKEWVAVGLSLVSFVGSGLAALNSTGVLNLTEDQIQTVIGLAVAALGLVGVNVVRDRVTPTDSVQTSLHVEPQDHFYGDRT